MSPCQTCLKSSENENERRLFLEYEGILVSDVKDQEVVKGNELFEDKEGTKALERATIQVELVFINVFDDKFVNI